MLIRISQDAYFMGRPGQWHGAMEAVLERTQAEVGNGVNSHWSAIVWRCFFVGVGTVSLNNKLTEWEEINYLSFRLKCVSVKPRVTILQALMPHVTSLPTLPLVLSSWAGLTAIVRRFLLPPPAPPQVKLCFVPGPLPFPQQILSFMNSSSPLHSPSVPLAW